MKTTGHTLDPVNRFLNWVESLSIGSRFIDPISGGTLKKVNYALFERLTSRNGAPASGTIPADEYHAAVRRAAQGKAEWLARLAPAPR